MRGALLYNRILVAKAAGLLLLAGILWPPLRLTAQTCNEPTYKVENGSLQLQVPRRTDSLALQQFLESNDLYPLPIWQWVRGLMGKEREALGWVANYTDSQCVTFSKLLLPLKELYQATEKILAFSKNSTHHVLPGGMPVALGINDPGLATKASFSDSMVTFMLPGYPHAKQVELAGSFTNWQYGALRMQKTPQGWQLPVPLQAGKHWYKFIVDHRWITDPTNESIENDGEGNMNSIIFKPNTLFKLPGYQKAKRVFLAGSFNGWNADDIKLAKNQEGWYLQAYVPDGTHTYRFVVDGKWMTDPTNAKKLPN
ncbi:MAG TPA: glycogen-binding domain-containing protein [Phnomibacter sp.]|nr:glycogen-binding domain-containing protein [Phnomibacter sp.]